MIFKDFKNIEVENSLGVSPPGKDTSIIAKHASRLNFKSALEIGTGTGFIPIYLEKCGLSCQGSDINPKSIACSVENARKNNCKTNFFVSDLFQKVTEKYDLIIFSAPLGDYSSSFMSKYLEIVKSVFPKDSKMLHKAAFELTKNQRAKLIQRFLNECQNYVNKNSMVLMSIHTPELGLVKNLSYKILDEYDDIWKLILIQY